MWYFIGMIGIAYYLEEKEKITRRCGRQQPLFQDSKNWSAFLLTLCCLLWPAVVVAILVNKLHEKGKL